MVQDHPYHEELIRANLAQIISDAKGMVPEKPYRIKENGDVIGPKRQSKPTEVKAEPALAPEVKPSFPGRESLKFTAEKPVTAESIGLKSAVNPSTPAGARSRIPKETPESPTVNNRNPKDSGVNAPSLEPITQENTEAPLPVEIPATNKRMLKFRAFGFLFLILAAVGAVVFVPSGNPTTYGRQSSPSFELIWLIQSGRVIDMGRVWTQTFILVAAAVACFYFSERDKPS
jgi:hypothetical protein